MGLESYLFFVKFQTPVSVDAGILLLEEAGMVYLKNSSTRETANDYGNLYFEQRTNKGLIEANILIPPGNTVFEEFSLRFSILSPGAVIDATFSLLKKLDDLSRIKVYDTEIRNHIMRQLRQMGKVDQHFRGLNIKDDDAIHKLCFILLDADDFKRNEFEIMKRKMVLDNTEGEVIEGGHATINYIEKKGLFNRFFGGIKKEL